MDRTASRSPTLYRETPLVTAAISIRFVPTAISRLLGMSDGTTGNAPPVTSVGAVGALHATPIVQSVNGTTTCANRTIRIRVSHLQTSYDLRDAARTRMMLLAPRH